LMSDGRCQARDFNWVSLARGKRRSGINFGPSTRESSSSGAAEFQFRLAAPSARQVKVGAQRSADAADWTQGFGCPDGSGDCAGDRGVRSTEADWSPKLVPGDSHGHRNCCSLTLAHQRDQCASTPAGASATDTFAPNEGEWTTPTPSPLEERCTSQRPVGAIRVMRNVLFDGQAADLGYGPHVNAWCASTAPA
jgi:hypothetical protein